MVRVRASTGLYAMAPAVRITWPAPVTPEGSTRRSGRISPSVLAEENRTRLSSRLAPTEKAFPRPNSVPERLACREAPRVSAAVRVRSMLP